MSAVKILTLGSLVTIMLVKSSLAGSIFSTGDYQHQVAQQADSNPIRPGSGLTASQENLATSSSYSAWYFGQATRESQQGSVSNLFLGLTGADQAPSGNSGQSSTNLAGGSLGVIQNGWTSYGAASTPSTVPAPAPAVSSSNLADAFINFGSGPYPEASTLTTGNALPFTSSPAFTHLFGSGGPTPTDIANFENEVLATIKTTYNSAGLPITLTTDPNTPAAHTMSVVSGASYTGSAGAIGITDVGNNGFSFIDKFSAAQTPDQLAIAIGHNLSHELMHAFGISNHPEQTGPYVDAATATFQTLADPGTSFSPVAAQLLSTLNFQAVGTSVVAGTRGIDGGQVLIPSPSPVPEPSTVALWAMAAGLLYAARRHRSA